MILDDNVLKQQLMKLSLAPANPVHYKYSAEFIESNDNRIPVFNVLAVHRIAKYTIHTSDYIFLSLYVTKSNYFKLIATNRRLLRLELIRTPTSITGSSTSLGSVVTEYYNAYLTDTTSEAVETRMGGLDGSHRDDLAAFMEIDVQLVERGLSEFRLWDAGGVYRNTTVQHILQGLMSQPLKTFSEAMDVGYNVTVVPPDNTEINYQLLIPNGVSLIDLPAWAQKKWGVYSAGLGYYLSQQMWTIFPLYDHTRYEKTIKRMTIINVPKNEMMGITNSYSLQDNELYIYATGDTKHIDPVDRLLDTSGTGFRSAIMGNLLDKFSESSNGNTTIPKDRNHVAVSFEQRPGELTQIKPVPGLFSSNPWNDASTVIANLVNIIILTWEASNPYLLTPGMPIKFIYKYRGQAYSLYGTLIGVDTKALTDLASTTDNRYVSNSLLTIACERAIH